MKNWEQTAVSGFFDTVIGIILFLWGIQAIEPIKIEWLGLQMRASLEPTFIALFMLAFFFLGMGIGTLVLTYVIYNLEKRLPSPPPPP